MGLMSRMSRRPNYLRAQRAVQGRPHPRPRRAMCDGIYGEVGVREPSRLFATRGRQAYIYIQR
jgi:hypothetical protein